MKFVRFLLRLRASAFLLWVVRYTETMYISTSDRGRKARAIYKDRLMFVSLANLSYFN